MPAPKTAWIYIRESREDQLAGYGPDVQEKLCRKLAAEKHLEVTNLVWEAGSGHSTEHRKVWQSLMRSIRRHAFDVLVVWKYSRMHRRLEDQFETMAIASRVGVEILSQADGIDITGPLGTLMKAVVGGFNEMEWHTTRDQTMAGRRARVERGYPLAGSKAPYGYVWAAEQSVTPLTGAGISRRTHLVPAEPEASIVKALWGWADAHPDEGYEQIAVWLNAQGHPSPKGGLWRKSTVRYLLGNPLYWGEAAAYRQVMTEVQVTDPFGQVSTERRLRPNRPEDWVSLPAENAPGIVSKEVAMRVLARIGERNHHHQSPRLIDKDAYLLPGGLIRCGVCGCAMGPRRRKHSHGGKGQERNYSCRAGLNTPKGDPRRHYLSISQERADDYAVSCLWTTLNDSDQAVAAVRRLAESREEVQQDKLAVEYDLGQARSKVKSLKLALSRLTEEDADEVTADYAAAREKVRSLESKLMVLSTADTMAERLVARLLRVIGLVKAKVDTVISLGTEPFLDPVANREELREALYALSAYVVVTPNPDASARAHGGNKLAWHIGVTDTDAEAIGTLNAPLETPLPLHEHMVQSARTP